MTDPTTYPATAQTPEPATVAAPVNAAAVADVRTLRRISRAEQERLSADADLQRRARAAQLDLELREQRRAAARQEREADAAAKQARAQARRARRAARQARLRAAAPRWAERALFVLPIMFPMSVAWVGQIRFAMTVMSWPLPAAIVFAAGFELSTAYVARLDWLSRAAGDSALLFRGATWGFAAGAATMNYWHVAGPGLAPNGEAVSYGLMSITGVVLWELLSIYRHRTALRDEGKLPAARPRFGPARWIWFNQLTRVAWLLTLRDGYTTTNRAWQAATGAVSLYGSPKNARKAVRAGCPVPRPDPSDDERDDADETTDHRDAEHRNQQRDIETGHQGRDDAKPHPPVRDRQRDSRTQHKHRDNPPQDQPKQDQPKQDQPKQDQQPDITTSPERPVNPESGCAASAPAVQTKPDVSRLYPSTGTAASITIGHRRTNPAIASNSDRRNGTASPFKDYTADEGLEPDGSRAGGKPRAALVPERGHGLDEPAVGTRMLAYARARLAEGAHLTGADLDRHFGTRDYGRRILRRLTTEAQAKGS